MSEIKLLEGQLAEWKKSDSHGGAPSVKFFLQSDEEVEYFQRFTSAKGRGKTHVAGQIFNLAVQVSEQDDQSQQPIEPTSRKYKYTYADVREDQTEPQPVIVIEATAENMGPEPLHPRRSDQIAEVNPVTERKPPYNRLVFDIVMMCKEPSFWDWVSIYSQGREAGEIESAEYVRKVCGVSSRSEIRTGTEAAKIFHEKIRRPYNAWNSALKKSFMEV